MKNLLKTIGALAIILATITSCKKTEDTITIESDPTISMAFQLQSEKGKSEKAILVGTQKALETALLNKEGPIFLKRISKTNNIFVPVVGPLDPSPVDFCWQAAMDFYDANIAVWQQQANSTCKNVSYCYECGGLAMLFDIAPNSPNCILAEASLETLYKIRKFDFSELEYDGSAASRFISSK